MQSAVSVEILLTFLSETALSVTGKNLTMWKCLKNTDN